MSGHNASTIPASGIYGCFHRDGRPLSEGERRALGLPAGAPGDTWSVTAHDNLAPEAVSRHDEGGETTVFAGHIEEANELAGRLGLGRSAAPAQIAAAALARFGGDTPAQVIGEWSLLHRHADGRLTLMLGAGVRDPIFYAVSGPRVAVAPDLFALSRLDWVDSRIDEAGLLFPVARAALRATRGDTTMLCGVRRLENGESVVIDPQGGVARRRADILLPQPRRSGSFADLVAEAEHLLRHIMATRLARTQRSAHMLSGGLDSSLLAWLAAEEHRTGLAPIAVTSAAPPGSGLPDETFFAQTVADTIGMECHKVWPDPEVNAYRPRLAILTGQNGPPLSNRHALTDALVAGAYAQGATMMIDGGYGEMTATVRLPRHDFTSRVRAPLRAVYHAIRALGAPPQPEQGPFHVRLAPHRLASLPDVMLKALAEPPPRTAMPGPGELFGYIPGIERGLALANEFYPGAPRTELPFRDMRLLRLFAGVPVATLLAGGPDRGVARQMMAGHLPDSIRLRPRGMPASPDHNLRLQQHALVARERMALFRKAGIDAWLDLDWLDTALAGMAETGPRDVVHGNEVQLTAITAEFLLWWAAQGSGTTP